MSAVTRFFGEYTAGQCALHRYFGHRALASLLKRAPNKVALPLRNLIQFLLRRSTKFGCQNDQNVFFAQDKEIYFYFTDKIRGFNFYRHGVKDRANQLLKAYFIDHIGFNDHDIIVDCGANYGDLGLGIKLLNKNTSYWPYEPDPSAFKCLKLNFPHARVSNCALGKNKCVAKFFLCPETGDSSLLKMSKKSTDEIEVQVTTLNHDLKDVHRVKLLKIEAEGGEPEVLQGATEILQKIEYIAVDGGPERGIECKTTIEKIINILTSVQFEVVCIDICSGAGRALFKNRSIDVKS